MELELTFGSAYCYCSTFIINGIEADSDDFGNQFDRDGDGAEDYCCGDMQFTRNEPTEEILKKYSITETDYDVICQKLEDGLSFGGCGWCA